LNTKESEVKPKRNMVDAKAIRKEVVKKRIEVIESSSSFDSEISLPLSKKELYTMLEATPKND
jgi:hypothetical protein